jgi:hypothetical protein
MQVHDRDFQAKQAQDLSQRSCDAHHSCLKVKFLGHLFIKVKIMSKTREYGRLRFSKDGQFGLSFQYSIKN